MRIPDTTSQPRFYVAESDDYAFSSWDTLQDAQACVYRFGSDPRVKFIVETGPNGRTQHPLPPPLFWPLKTGRRLMPDEPGDFATVRKHDIHTGVDLYCELGTEVVAMEPGEVIGIERFTGEFCKGEDYSPWWNNTYVILVRGDWTGKVFAYGEVSHLTPLNKGNRVEQGDVIGVIRTPVLKSFKGRPMVMLHMEVYSGVPEGYTFDASTSGAESATVWWPSGEKMPQRLEDVSVYLGPLYNGKFDLKDFDGKFAVDPDAPRKDSKWWEVWGGRP